MLPLVADWMPAIENLRVQMLNLATMTMATLAGSVAAPNILPILQRKFRKHYGLND